MTKLTKLFLALGLLLILSSCTKPVDNNVAHSQPSLNLKQQRPIIFLHGSGGSENDLLPFANAIADASPLSSSHLQLKVKADNSLTFLGELSEKEQLPLIFVGFEDGDAPIDQWSQGLENVVETLVKHYQFESIDLVGFSNGGLAAAYYAETASRTPRLNKVVMIGAPFNDLEPLNQLTSLDFADRSLQDPYLEQFLAKKEQLPQEVAVLSIAGDLDDGSLSDGVVPITSALSSRLIFPDYVNTYEEYLSVGSQASHVGLVSQNQEVIDVIQGFLFDLPEKPEGRPPKLVK